MHTDGALYRYLKGEILPQLAAPPYGAIEMTTLSFEKSVYLYREERSHAQMVGKSFKHSSMPLDKAWHRVENEYANLKLLRDNCGMKGDTYHVVAPLGKNRELSALLVLENAPGKTLDYYIARAVYERRSDELFYKLSDLARFLAKLHRNSETGRQVSPDLPHWYLRRVLHSLRHNLFHNGETDAIKGEAADWWNRNGVFGDREVIVHGDATPTNFLFHHRQVTGIDLEKMKWADRCWDLGFIAAELKHHFMWRAGNGAAAEPFIGHFLWEYAVARGDTGSFYAITRRLPLYMTLGLLRIARNGWLNEGYRYSLVGEAKLCLRYRP